MDAPSVRERRLAGELKLLRTAVQLHGKDVAERLGWSATGLVGRVRRHACALVLHALLQTPAYTRHLVRTSWRNPSVTEVDRRVQVCRRRQDLLDPAAQPHPLRLSAVVDESVLLRTPAGADGADVLRGSSSTWSRSLRGRTSPFRCCPSPPASQR